MSPHFTIGGYDYRRTSRRRHTMSNSAEFKSSLLIMCIDAPESTTNSRSSDLRVDAGRHLFSEGEKNVALSCSFNFNTLLASFHTASRAPCSCHSVSSCERSSNFGALGLRSWGSPGQIYPSEGFWSRICVTRYSLREFYALDWFLHVWALPENRLRRLHVLKYTTQLPCVRRSTFRRSLFLLVITFLIGSPWSIVNFNMVEQQVPVRFHANNSSSA